MDISLLVAIWVPADTWLIAYGGWVELRRGGASEPSGVY